MESQQICKHGNTFRIKKSWLLAAAACAAGVALNLLGVRLVAALNLPLFLDTVGTILISALGGYIPGIAVGFFTNVINGLSDYTNAYYGVINVLIAVSAAYFSQRNAYRHFFKALLAVIVFALIGGGVGSVLTWFLYGHGFGEGISAPLAHYFFDQGISSVFLAQLLADFLIDVIDKAVSVAFVALVLCLLPKRVHDLMNFSGWRDNTLRPNVHLSEGGQPCRSISLGAKIMLLISAAILVISMAVTMITFQQFHDAAIASQNELIRGLAAMAAKNIDGDRVNEYIEQGESAPGYMETKKVLASVMSSSPDVAFVYAYKILPDGCHVVFDIDTEEVPGEPPGAVVPFDPAFDAYLPAMLAGEEIDQVITDESYGLLMTFYQPVYDSNGVCQCYAVVDISMPNVVADEQVFSTRILSLFMSFFIMLVAIGFFLARRELIVPINSMARAAGAFAYDSENARADSVGRIRKLKIQTGDEIENLYHALEKTTEDMVSYIADAQEKNEKIAKLQQGLIMVLADIVESRDQCTGDHVRKTAAYTRVIMEQLRRDGVYTDELTDEFMQDVMHSAPLHDVGKIHIPDAVLNKPGKLTDDEFKLMREHAKIGSDIITNAIRMVSDTDSGYLKEARNLANYHHERWDGKGYPEGLKGEAIPLSARIMAVADVFDALVSKRSYKEPFSFEKAMSIIRESSGTHFDPNVAQAFLEAEDEVRRIEESHQEMER